MSVKSKVVFPSSQPFFIVTLEKRKKKKKRSSGEESCFQGRIEGEDTDASYR